MRKKILCVFSLILYTLIACTSLSRKIEEEMLTVTEARFVDYTTVSGSTVELPIRVVFTDTEGDHVYEIVEGTGWESGPRFQEVPRGSWALDIPNGVARVTVERDYNFVYSASRIPQPGDLAQILQTAERADDRYLAIYHRPGLLDELFLPSSAQVIAQSETALLLYMTNVPVPFLQQRARTMTVTTDLSTRIYSLTDVSAFFAQLPAVAAVVLALVAGIVFWIWACFLAFREEGKPVLFWLDVAIVVATLCLLPFLLQRIDFPASLMPPENILDWSYYQSQFSSFFAGLADFPEVSQEITAARDQGVASFWRLLQGGCAAIAVGALLEGVFLWFTARASRRLSKKSDVETEI